MQRTILYSMATMLLAYTTHVFAQTGLAQFGYDTDAYWPSRIGGSGHVWGRSLFSDVLSGPMRSEWNSTIRTNGLIITAENDLIGVSGNTLYSLDSDNGNIRWQLNLGDQGRTPGAIDKLGNIYMLTVKYKLFKVAANGNLLEEAELVPGASHTNYAWGNVLVASNGDIIATRSWPGKVFRLSAQSLSEVWSASPQIRTDDGRDISGSFSGSPALDSKGDIVLATSNSIQKLSGATGDTLWTQKVYGPFDNTNSLLVTSCSPAVDSQDNVYAFATNSVSYETVAIKLNSNGDEQWKTHIPFLTQSNVVLTEEEDVVVMNKTHIMKLSSEDGSILWGNPVASMASVEPNYGYIDPVISRDGFIIVCGSKCRKFDVETGELSWEFSTAYSTFSPSIGKDGSLVVPSSNGIMLFKPCPQWHTDNADARPLSSFFGCECPPDAAVLATNPLQCQKGNPPQATDGPTTAGSTPADSQTENQLSLQEISIIAGGIGGTVLLSSVVVLLVVRKCKAKKRIIYLPVPEVEQLGFTKAQLFSGLVTLRGISGVEFNSIDPKSVRSTVMQGITNSIREQSGTTKNPNATKFIAFVSHSHHDNSFATAVYNELEAELHEFMETRRAQGEAADLFFDIEDLERLGSIQENVKKSENLVVVLTKAYLESRWCLLELLTALSLGIPVHVMTNAMEPFDYSQLRKAMQDTSHNHRSECCWCSCKASSLATTQEQAKMLDESLAVIADDNV